MTQSEFIDFYNEFRKKGFANGLLNDKPFDPVFERYRNIVDKIRPHFTGEIPDALNKAFPNESKQIMEYRCSIFEPVTLPIVTQALDDVGRCFLSSKFGVAFDNPQMDEYIKNKSFAGVDFFTFLFRIFYARRASNPNGWLIWNVPTSRGTTDDRIRIDVEPKMISEKQIVYESDDLLIYTPKTQTKENQIQILTPKDAVKFYVVTSDFYGHIKTSNDGNDMLYIDYRHGLGKLPALKNGGRPLIIECQGVDRLIYHTDFMAAIPHLNRYIVAENQETSIALSSGFPIKFLRGISCRTCKGQKKVIPKNIDPQNPNKLIDCDTCKGQGRTFNMSPLEGYYFSGESEGATESERMAYLNQKPIQFESAPVGILQHIGKRLETARLRAEESLNIKQQKTFQETEGAKRIDNESLYAQIGRITDDLFSIARKSLECIQALRFRSRAPIALSQPTSFDNKTESELLREFKQCNEGVPNSLRRALYLDMICKRFSDDEKYIRLEKLAMKYTPAYLMSDEEIQNCVNAGLLKRDEAIKAKFVFQCLQMIDANIIMEAENDDTIFELLNEKIAPLLPDAIPVNVEFP